MNKVDRGSNPEFEARIRQSMLASCEYRKGPPTEIEAMLDRHGAVVTAERLVISGDIQAGLRQMVEAGQEQLSFESIMQEPQFTHLFDEGTLEAARFRLDLAKMEVG